MSGVTEEMMASTVKAGTATAANPKTPEGQAANIKTAREMHSLGQDLAKVGAWLHATAAGAFRDVEQAIEHILKVS
jgi:hypothetical protein